MKVRIIYNHKIFSTIAVLEKGNVVELPDDEALLYIDRDWAVPTEDKLTFQEESEELEGNEEFEDEAEEDEE